MKKAPRKLLSTRQRKDMWKDAVKLLNKLDKKINFSEIYLIGSFVSKKKRPADIDFCVVTKGINNSSAYPIDIVIVPNCDKTEVYIKDIKKWMKKRYGQCCKPIRLK